MDLEVCIKKKSLHLLGCKLFPLFPAAAVNTGGNFVAPLESTVESGCSGEAGKGSDLLVAVIGLGQIFFGFVDAELFKITCKGFAGLLLHKLEQILIGDTYIFTNHCRGEFGVGIVGVNKGKNTFFQLCVMTLFGSFHMITDLKAYVLQPLQQFFKRTVVIVGKMEKVFPVIGRGLQDGVVDHMTDGEKNLQLFGFITQGHILIVGLQLSKMFPHSTVGST